MNTPIKVQQKVFAKKTPRKHSEPLDDWDISEDVLSESFIIAPRPKGVTEKKIAGSFGVSKACSEHGSFCTTPAEPSYELKKNLQIPHSKFRKCSMKSESDGESSEECHMSLQSEISSLLQQLIQRKKKKNSDISLNSKSESTPFVMKKSNFHQCNQNDSSEKSEHQGE
ncbi:unnamed protein product [Moneuplotes crassus]|uniref:Uncharacterized protein n=1 Tax=Euplotes crassus TaxID=5936 RepID=A0AAD1XF73_EUPCR|nr:unnamed protein product [Moneuplotes crassus]